MRRIYYNFTWKPAVTNIAEPNWAQKLPAQDFFDKLEEVGEIRTTAEGFSMFVPGDKFNKVQEAFNLYAVSFTLEEAPETAKTSTWALRSEANGPEVFTPLTPFVLECAYCHNPLDGNAAQIGVHLSEHLRDIADEAGIAR